MTRTPFAKIGTAIGRCASCGGRAASMAWQLPMASVQQDRHPATARATANLLEAPLPAAVQKRRDRRHHRTARGQADRSCRMSCSIPYGVLVFQPRRWRRIARTHPAGKTRPTATSPRAGGVELVARCRPGRSVAIPARPRAPSPRAVPGRQARRNFGEWRRGDERNAGDPGALVDHTPTAIAELHLIGSYSSFGMVRIDGRRFVDGAGIVLRENRSWPTSSASLRAGILTQLARAAIRNKR